MLDSMTVTEAPVRDIAVASESARAQAETQAMILMARKFPRDVDRSFENARKSTQRASFAEKAFFSFPRGGVEVKGPSINMAREFARCWGNIQYEIRVVHDDAESMTIEGRAWDLETNTVTANQSSFKKLIFRKGKGWVTPDERDLRELVSKNGSLAVRNSLLQLFPKDMIDDLLDECFATLKVKVKSSGSLKDQAKKAADAFAAFKVTLEMLENSRGKKMDKWDEEDIATLRSAYEGIKTGQIAIEDIFNASSAAKQQPGTVDISGLTVEPAPEPVKEPVKDKRAGKITADQIQQITDLAAKLGMPPEALRQICIDTFKEGVFQLLTADQADQLIAQLNG